MRKVQAILTKPGKVFFITLLSCLFAFQAMAQQTPALADTSHIDSLEQKTATFLKKLVEDIEAEKAGALASDLEIDGLIVDETVTKAGRDFYQLFYNQWEAPPNARNFTIRISERPAIGIATVVLVDVNDSRVIETPLQPRYDIIEGIAQQAARSIYDYLLNYEQIQQELAGEDLSGSGIY